MSRTVRDMALLIENRRPKCEFPAIAIGNAKHPLSRVNWRSNAPPLAATLSLSFHSAYGLSWIVPVNGLQSEWGLAGPERPPLHDEKPRCRAGQRQRRTTWR